MIRKVLVLGLLLSGLSASGTIAVVQPYLTEQDYRSADQFRRALEPYFEETRSQVIPDEPLLVVLPEYIGTWLVAVDEGRRIFRSEDINGAMTRLILRHPIRFLCRFTGSIASRFKAPVMGHAQRSIFLMQSNRAREAYVEVFSELARRYSCWIVAGSILLPEARVDNGEIALAGKKQSLMNQSFVFNSEGGVAMVAPKVYPVGDELAFLDASPVDRLTVVETDLGHLGVLVCADSWYPDCYAMLESQAVDIIAVPSFASPAEIWETPWKGYNPPDHEPGDVDPGDKDGSHPEFEMWDKYALQGRLGDTSAMVGVNSFLLGDFWGLTGTGISKIVVGGSAVRQAESHTGSDLLIYQIP